MIGKTIGQYRVIDKIGEGGMGAVYKAEDTTLNRLVALKTLSGHLTESEEAQERFVREAQSASSLNHPNITTVHEFIEDGDTRLICMEYVEGKTIKDMVESGVVSVRKAIDIITQIAEALEAAHNKGILHRDVKSANIMVNMEGRVKVMDFGLAHMEAQSQLTRTGTTMGTLSYSSPEQISGRTVDRRSEIFSLGVVFYELLTGQLPFKASNEAEILFAIINNEPPKLSKVRDDVPELVEAVVSKMLEKDPDLRYQSCGDVIGDLTGIRKEMETSTVGITGVLQRVSVDRRKAALSRVAYGVLAIAVILTGYLVLKPDRPNLDPDKAVVTIFKNIQGDEALDKYASYPVPWITQGLQESGLLKVVPFASALQLNTQLNDAVLSSNESIIDLMARGTRAGIVITGSYWEQGEELYFQAEIVDAIKGRRLDGTDPISGPFDNPEIILDELQQRIIGILAIHRDAGFGKTAAVLSKPASLEVFNEYQAGLTAFLLRKPDEGLRHSYRAMEMDSTYFSPLIQAIVLTHNYGMPVQCDSLIQIAESRYTGITDYERLMLSFMKGWLYGDRELAYRSSVNLVSISQDDMSYYEAGLDSKCFNRPLEALGYFEKIDLNNPMFQDWSGNWSQHYQALYMLGRFREALKIVHSAQEMHPDVTSYITHEARLLAALGKDKQLDKLIERSLTKLPTSNWSAGTVMRAAAESFLRNGEVDQANEILDRAIVYYEEQDLSRSAGIALALWMRGRTAEAKDIFRELSQNDPDDTDYWGYLGIIAAMEGNREEAELAGRRLEALPAKYLKGDHTYGGALLAAHLGETSQALVLLRQAFNEGTSYGAYLHYSWVLEPLRGNPQFEELIRPKG